MRERVRLFFWTFLGTELLLLTRSPPLLALMNDRNRRQRHAGLSDDGNRRTNAKKSGQTYKTQLKTKYASG